MRVDVKKYLFFGVHKKLEEFFQKAQEIGMVQFIDKSSLRIKEVPGEIQNVIQAIKIIRGLPILHQEEFDSYSEADALVEEILQLKHQIEKLEEERRIAQLEMSRIEIFGNFSLDDIDYLKKQAHRETQFFFAKKGVMDRSDLPEELFFVGSEHGLDYFVAFNPKMRQYPNMIEMKIEHNLHSLQNRYNEIKIETNRLEEKLKTFAKYNTFLHHALTFKLNSYNLERVKGFADPKMEGALFSVEGWVPENKIEEIKKFVIESDVHMDEILIETAEVAPTYLENQGFSRVGEDLVHVYDTPANNDKDPSLWVLLSFALFFAIIIGDGGYGLLFLAGALFARFKYPKMKAAGRRFWTLLMTLFLFCVGWGLLTNSFFGINFGPENPIRSVSALDWLAELKAAYHFENQDAVYQFWVKKYPSISQSTTGREFLTGASKVVNGEQSYEMLDKFSDGILMELALLVGVIHISLSFLRYIGRNWAGIGWIIGIFGCYFYFPLFLKGTSLFHYALGADREILAQEGMYMIYGGLILAVVLSLIQNKLFGLLEITNLIQVFADILSYLRLYALALAGTIISATVNDIASGLIFVLAIPLIIVGHSLNMVLSVIGGVIHGLRLNFIEWYHYCFEGGGKQFDPLRKMEID